MQFSHSLIKLSVTILCATLGACVTKPVFDIGGGAPATNTKSGVTVAVVDQRPQGDRESSVGSMLVSSDSYGIHILGDDRFVPAPTAALANRVERLLAQSQRRPASVTVTLKRYNTQNNAQAAMRNSAIGAANLGPLGAVIGEAVLGKLREQNIDARKPFVMSYAEAAVDIRWADNTRSTHDVAIVKANNYSESDIQEQKTVVAKTASAALDALAQGLVAAGGR